MIPADIFIDEGSMPADKPSSVTRISRSKMSRSVRAFIYLVRLAALTSRTVDIAENFRLQDAIN